jgi:16S rRNA A1518/A1519 N6-dimethyltransferase RsmA/KsgA/DIM1 with predicted DNA glycosylase/AP lyase activity
MLILGDVLTSGLSFLNICVANISYQTSSPLVYELASTNPLFAMLCADVSEIIYPATSSIAW